MKTKKTITFTVLTAEPTKISLLTAYSAGNAIGGVYEMTIEEEYAEILPECRPKDKNWLLYLELWWIYGQCTRKA